jgi:hypothetical protein
MRIVYLVDIMTLLLGMAIICGFIPGARPKD